MKSIRTSVAICALTLLAICGLAAMPTAASAHGWHHHHHWHHHWH